MPYLWPVVLLLCGRWSWRPAEHNLGIRTRSVRHDGCVLAVETLCGVGDKEHFCGFTAAVFLNQLVNTAVKASLPITLSILIDVPCM